MRRFERDRLTRRVMHGLLAGAALAACGAVLFGVYGPPQNPVQRLLDDVASKIAPLASPEELRAEPPANRPVEALPPGVRFEHSTFRWETIAAPSVAGLELPR